MTKVFIIACVALIFVAACSTENKPVDPTMMINARYTGITFTDVVGNVIGPVDADDWNLYPSNSIPEPSYKPVTGDAGNNTILPNGYGIGAAFPNPFNGQISLIRIMTPAATPISIRVIDQEDREVFYDARVLEAGEHEFTWSPGIAWRPEGSEYREIPDGIYRVLYTIVPPGSKPFSGHGDVWLTHSDNEWWQGGE